MASYPTPARLPRRQRRAQLLQAASAVFGRSGYHQASMDDIAEEAGVSKPVLYQHFPSKLELYLALLDQAVAALVERIEQAMASTRDNKQRVYAAVGSYFDFIESDGEAYRLVFESDLRNDPQVATRVQHAQDACIAAIATVVSADARLDDTRAALLTTALTGASEASARAWIEHRADLDRDEAISLVAALLWGGISAFPAAR